MQTFTPETDSKPDSTRALKVWVQLAEMFGKAFYRENGDTPQKLWTQAIGRLTDDQLKHGLANLGNDGLAYPPNLSQFVVACKKPKTAGHWDALPPPKEDREAEAEKAWQRMEMLAGRKLR